LQRVLSVLAESVTCRDVPGGKRKGASASGRGNRYIGAALSEVPVSAGRTQSFPGAKCRRLVKRMPKKLVKRMPKKKALVATGTPS
jgi:hypothetical protein